MKLQNEFKLPRGCWLILSDEEKGRKGFLFLFLRAIASQKMVSMEGVLEFKNLINTGIILCSCIKMENSYVSSVTEGGFVLLHC